MAQAVLPALCPGEREPIEFSCPPSMPKCKPEKFPNAGMTADTIGFLFQTQQFCLLEKALVETVSSGKRFPNGVRLAEGAYQGFQRILTPSSYSPGWRGHVDKWRAAYPTSIYIPFIEARLAYVGAWAARGEMLPGSQVSPEARELFNVRLQEAETILLGAPAALKETPLWHQLLLAVVLDSKEAQTPPDKVFAEAVKRWPDYYAFYDLAITRINPDWGSTWEQLDQFIAALRNTLRTVRGS